MSDRLQVPLIPPRFFDSLQRFFVPALRCAYGGLELGCFGVKLTHPLSGSTDPLHQGQACLALDLPRPQFGTTFLDRLPLQKPFTHAVFALQPQ